MKKKLLHQLFTVRKVGAMHCMHVFQSEFRMVIENFFSDRMHKEHFKHQDSVKFIATDILQEKIKPLKRKRTSKSSPDVYFHCFDPNYID
jgi:hypothetical protein